MPDRLWSFVSQFQTLCKYAPQYSILISKDYGDPSLVGYWSFDEGSGTVAYDRSGKNNNGSITGTHQWITGGLVFTQAGTTRVNMGNHANSNFGTGDFTWAISMVFDGFNNIGSAWNVVVAKGTVSVSPNVYIGGSSNKLGFFSNGQNAWMDAEIVGQKMSIVGTRENGIMKIYVNGILQGDTGVDGTSVTNTDSLVMGSDATSPGRYFNGTVYDFRMYNRTLSAQEAMAIYNATK
jgi:hypothetical protein